jgi:hypothetical protein
MASVSTFLSQASPLARGLFTRRSIVSACFDQGRRQAMKTVFRAMLLLSLGSAVSVQAQDVNLTSDGKVPGKPFEYLQQQINLLTGRLNAAEAALAAAETALAAETSARVAAVQKLEDALKEIQPQPQAKYQDIVRGSGIGDFRWVTPDQGDITYPDASFVIDVSSEPDGNNPKGRVRVEAGGYFFEGMATCVEVFGRLDNAIPDLPIAHIIVDIVETNFVSADGANGRPDNIYIVARGGPTEQFPDGVRARYVRDMLNTSRLTNGCNLGNLDFFNLPDRAEIFIQDE